MYRFNVDLGCLSVSRLISESSMNGRGSMSGHSVAKRPYILFNGPFRFLRSADARELIFLLAPLCLCFPASRLSHRLSAAVLPFASAFSTSSAFFRANISFEQDKCSSGSFAKRVVHLSASDDMTSEVDADKGELLGGDVDKGKPSRDDDDKDDLHAEQGAMDDDDLDNGEADHDDADHGDVDRDDADKGDADRGNPDKGDVHQGDGEEDLDVSEIEDIEPFGREKRESKVVLLAGELVVDILSKHFSFGHFSFGR
ncbi:hypothetical protein BJ912DRAFT_273436 [Pholiota molesta]|nr:hypothetical protein BJ912DRAFT_273436 [Pholiota molesta]